MSTFLKDERPPTCLHILGQGLVNAIHAEGKVLQARLAALESDLQELKERMTRSLEHEALHKEYSSDLHVYVDELNDAIIKHFPSTPQS